jgi:L-lactate dehydrogenase complex protein LldG
LHKVRTAIGRSVGQAPEAPPEVYLNPRPLAAEARIGAFTAALEALAGKVHRAATPADAGRCVERLLAGRSAVASNAPWLAECGVRDLAGVRGGITDREHQRALCASAAVGITGADYALADTGTLVMMASPAEQRLVSLLPPVHVAVVPCSRLLSGLDELLEIVPDPAALTSSMVLITGPSRTADIEQILVRGVHGPGEIHVILVETQPAGNTSVMV